MLGQDGAASDEAGEDLQQQLADSKDAARSEAAEHDKVTLVQTLMQTPMQTLLCMHGCVQGLVAQAPRQAVACILCFIMPCGVICQTQTACCAWFYSQHSHPAMLSQHLWYCDQLQILHSWILLSGGWCHCDQQQIPSLQIQADLRQSKEQLRTTLLAAESDRAGLRTQLAALTIRHTELKGTCQQHQQVLLPTYMCL